MCRTFAAVQEYEVRIRRLETDFRTERRQRPGEFRIFIRNIDRDTPPVRAPACLVRRTGAEQLFSERANSRIALVATPNPIRRLGQAPRGD